MGQERRHQLAIIICGNDKYFMFNFLFSYVLQKTWQKQQKLKKKKIGKVKIDRKTLLTLLFCNALVYKSIYVTQTVIV